MAKSKKTAGAPAKNIMRRAARASQSSTPGNDPNATTALYAVLAPFKFAGVVVKPPAWIELSEADAAPYQDAGVLGIAPGVVPDKNAVTDDAGKDADAGSEADGNTATDGDGAAAGGTE